MKSKELYSNYKPLINVLFWILILLAVIFYWPRDTPIENAPVLQSSTIYSVSELPTTITSMNSTHFQLSTTTERTSTEPTSTFEQEPPRYGFTENDIYLLATLLCGSKFVDGDGEFDFDYGRDEEYDQISLVLCVVMNRVRSELYPDTVNDVVWQQGQFSVMPQWKKRLPTVSDIALLRVQEWCDAYDQRDLGAQSIPEDHLYFCGDGIRNYSR